MRRNMRKLQGERVHRTAQQPRACPDNGKMARHNNRLRMRRLIWQAELRSRHRNRRPGIRRYYDIDLTIPL